MHLLLFHRMHMFLLSFSDTKCYVFLRQCYTLGQAFVDIFCIPLLTPITVHVAVNKRNLNLIHINANILTAILLALLKLKTKETNNEYQLESNNGITTLESSNGITANSMQPYKYRNTRMHITK